MGLFRALIGVAIETAKLPIDVALDVVQIPKDLVYEDPPGHRTIARLEKIKDEAAEAE